MQQKWLLFLGLDIKVGMSLAWSELIIFLLAYYKILVTYKSLFIIIISDPNTSSSHLIKYYHYKQSLWIWILAYLLATSKSNLQHTVVSFLSSYKGLNHLNLKKLLTPRHQADLDKLIRWINLNSLLDIAFIIINY